MTRWQYAWLTDQPTTNIFFSHPQGPGLINELYALLGPTLIPQQSTEWVLTLDRSKVNFVYLSGLLGDRGWELVAVETRPQQGPMMGALQTTWFFKRPAD